LTLSAETSSSNGGPAATIEDGEARSRIAVIVATCGRPRELDQCLASLSRQTHAPERIVVVDDAPGGEEAPATVRVHDPDGTLIRYVEGESAGLAAAHNRGLLEVDSPLVAFTDDDVVADPGWLAAICDAFSAGPRVGCVTGMIRPFEIETQVQAWVEGWAGFNKGSERRVYDLGENRPDDPLFPFAAGKFGSGANMAFSTAAMREMDGFDAALGAGTECRSGDELAAFFEVLMRGYQLVYEPAAVVQHRHPREYEGLRRQVYGYGVGLTSYLTKCVVDRPGLLARAGLRLPQAVVYVLSPSSAKNVRRPHDYPRELTRLELRGMLAGPPAYLRGRARQRRLSRAGTEARTESAPARGGAR
jgi:GT2 family glycosyltransferase